VEEGEGVAGGAWEGRGEGAEAEGGGQSQGLVSRLLRWVRS
jgi:hypothetical protein